MRGIIYRYKNKLNGKVYIGQTVDEYKRIQDHKFCKGKNTHFHNAIKKYGFDNFEYDVLFEMEFDSINDAKIVLDDRERQFILEHNSFNKDVGYNLTFGGGGSGGYKHNDEFKTNLSKRVKGVPRSEDVKNKIRLNHTNRIRVMCEESGKVYDSIRQCEDDIGVYKGDLRRKLKSGSCVHKGIHYKIL